MESNVIFTENTIAPQIERLKIQYPNLKVEHFDERRVRLYGEILVNQRNEYYVKTKYYTVKIVCPLNSSELPYVIDSGNHIDSKYRHRYPGGKLCLETDSAIRIRFINGFDLVAWMLEFVEPYYFSYEHFMRYGFFPYGERSHGYIGILEFYKELFSTFDISSAYEVMRFIANGKYRGHLLCPCGSGEKLRHCHGPMILEFCNDSQKKLLVSSDFQSITKGEK